MLEEVGKDIIIQEKVKKFFSAYVFVDLGIIMFSPIPSNISQYNTDMLKEQYHKIQQYHKEKQ